MQITNNKQQIINKQNIYLQFVMSKNNSSTQVKRPSSYQFLPHYYQQAMQRTIFTQQQQQFFASTIGMFQVVNKDLASYKSVKNNLKRTRLPNQTIQTIVNNSKLKQFKQGICFEDLKKIFRGVALAQNELQPSVQNISNFPINSSPVFYQLRQVHNNAHQNNSSDRYINIKNIINNRYLDKSCLSQNPDRSEATSATASHRNVFKSKLNGQNDVKNYISKIQNVDEQKPMQKAARNVSPSDVNSTQVFQAYWNSNKTQNNKISGFQVKKLCQNENNREHLSKAWKLCNISFKGFLTKGQFYVFLKLIQLFKSKKQIPEKLSDQMQKTIKMLDQSKFEFKRPIQTNFDEKKSLLSTLPVKSSSKTLNLSKQRSQYAQNFSQKRQEKKNKQINQMNGIFKQRCQKLNERVQQLLELKNQSQTSMNCLIQLDKYIAQIDRKNNEIQKQIKSLKDTQNIINSHMKSACMSIKIAVEKQNNLIVELSQQCLKNKQICQQNVKNVENIQKKSIYQSNTYLEVNSMIKSGKFQYPRKSQRSMRQQIQRYNCQQHSKSVKNNQTHNSSHNPSSKIAKRVKTNTNLRKMTNLKQSIQSLSSHQVNQKQLQAPLKLRTSKQRMSQIIDQDNVLTPKQIKTLQLVNYLAPIQQDQYGVVVQRITSMDQAQLAKLYRKLYQTYIQSQDKTAQFSSQLKSKHQGVSQLTAKNMIHQHSLVIQGSTILVKPQLKQRKSFGSDKNGQFWNNNSHRKSQRHFHTDYQQQQLDSNLFNFINQGDFDQIEDMQTN